MRVNLASTNLILSTIAYKKAQTAYDSRSLRLFGKSKKIKNKYNAIVYYQYYTGRIKEWFRKIKKSLASMTSKRKTYTSNPTIKKSLTVQKEGTRAVYRRNYKGRRVICGKLYFYESKMKLTLHKKLLHKYDIPNFKHSVEFQDFSQVKGLIHFDQNKNEYYLNEFERLEDTFL